jgi:branched-chain amino acid transport system substrate-binding protein
MKGRRLMMGVALLATMGLAACGGDDEGSGGGTASSDKSAKKEPLRIGAILPLSGAAAPFGVPGRDALEAAVKKLNADGGADGRQVILSIHDHKTDPTECARGATQLIRQDKVHALISNMGSCTLADAPVAAQNKIPVMSMDGTIDVTLKENDFFPWVFRVATSDLESTDKIFEQVVKSGAKKIGVFYQEDAYGENTAKYIDGLAKEAGIEVVSKVSAPLTATDVTGPATQIRNSKPDAVILQSGSAGMALAFARAKEQVGLDAPLYGGLGLSLRPFIEEAGDTINGLRFLTMVNWVDPGTPELEELAELVKTTGNELRTGNTEVTATTSLKVLAEAVKGIEGEPTGQAIRDNIEKLNGFKAVARGDISFSPDDHDGANGALILVEARDGKPVEVTE